ncbi:hypothetical protein HAX54_029798 [Datura stramonium]|uniref:Uncharacterized protein n=1 Tax=Datura stramonium TaxID=4076 RepID=A0ABS8V7Y4_DATST|nr:hypothetical protein [Datura stramonium]
MSFFSPDRYGQEPESTLLLKFKSSLQNATSSLGRPESIGAALQRKHFKLERIDLLQREIRRSPARIDGIIGESRHRHASQLTSLRTMGVMNKILKSIRRILMANNEFRERFRRRYWEFRSLSWNCRYKITSLMANTGIFQQDFQQTLQTIDLKVRYHPQLSSQSAQAPLQEIWAYVYTRSDKGKLYFVRRDREKFDLEDLLRAPAEVLGSGSFGSSYKAELPIGKPISCEEVLVNE